MDKTGVEMKWEEPAGAKRGSRQSLVRLSLVDLEILPIAYNRTTNIGRLLGSTYLDSDTCRVSHGDMLEVPSQVPSQSRITYAPDPKSA